MDIRFGKLYVMHPEAAEKIKDIHRLPERDAYVGKVGNNDPDMLSGNYDWWTLPDQSMLYVTAGDIDLFRKYQSDHDIPPPEGKIGDSFYAALAQRAQNFVDEQEKEGRIVQLIGAPPLEAFFHDARQKLATAASTFMETMADLGDSFHEFLGGGKPF